MKGRNHRASLVLRPERPKRASLPVSLAQKPAPALFSNEVLLSVSTEESSPVALRVVQGEGRRLKPRTAMSLSRVSCYWSREQPAEYCPFPFLHLRHSENRPYQLPHRPKPSQYPSKRSFQHSPPPSQPSPFPSVPRIRLISVISPPLRRQSSHSLEPWTTERRRSKAAAY